MPANDDDVKVEKLKLRTTVIVAIVGPIIALACNGIYSYLNHAESARGYEVLAKVQNEHAEHIGALMARVDKLEKIAHAPSTQPVAAPARINIEKYFAAKAPSKAAMRAPEKAPSRAPMTLKAAQQIR